VTIEQGKSEKRPPKAKAPPVAGPKGRGVVPNPKLADQTRKVLGKHYASKYRTGRRG
jgi:hypothetical protein